MDGENDCAGCIWADGVVILLYHLCGWVPGSKIIKANLLDTILLRHL